jgi:hypothetical protein
MRARALALGGALLLVPTVWGAGVVLSMRASSPSPSAEAAERSDLPAAVATGRAGAPAGPVVFASGWGVSGWGVRLHLPADEVRAVAFHEASFPGAVGLRPMGRCGLCRHPRFEAPADDRSGLRYLVLPPRGRGSPPTSAVDVVVGPEAVVRSPVTGRVRSVERYRLYGRHRDVRVALRPNGAPGIDVVILHLRGVRLSEGDRVEASVTPIGRARRFAFRSQVDRFVPGGLPHVHLEVVDARARRQATKRG